RRRIWPARGRHRRWWRREWFATGFRWRRRAGRRDPLSAGCAARADPARFPNHVGDDRNALHLGRQFAGDVADDVAVGAGHHERDRAQTVFVEEPVADIRHVFELLADLKLKMALRDIALGFARVVDDQRGAAYFVGA